MNIDEFYIAMSWGWCDTTLDEDELKKLAEKIDAKPRNYPFIFFYLIFFIIPTWSIESFFALLSAGTCLPWLGWDPDSMIKKKNSWYKFGIIWMLIPIAWIGLPIAYLFGLGFFSQLFKYIRQNA